MNTLYCLIHSHQQEVDIQSVLMCFEYLPPMKLTSVRSQPGCEGYLAMRDYGSTKQCSQLFICSTAVIKQTNNGTVHYILVSRLTLFRCQIQDVFLVIFRKAQYCVEEEIIRHAGRGDIAYPIINTGGEVPLPVPFKMVMPVACRVYDLLYMELSSANWNKNHR